MLSSCAGGRLRRSRSGRVTKPRPAAEGPRIHVAQRRRAGAAGTFTDSFTYAVNAEDGTIEARYKLQTPVLFDGSAGRASLGETVGVALGVSRTSGSGRADTDSRIPHPFFDDRDREVAGEAGDLTRTETAVHLQLYYLKTSGKLRVVLTAGPS